MKCELVVEKFTSFVPGVTAEDGYDIQFLPSAEYFAYDKKLCMIFVPTIVASEDDHARTRWFSNECTGAIPNCILVLFDIRFNVPLIFSKLPRIF